MLDNIGTITTYPSPELKDFQILNPDWLVKGVYKILKEAEDGDGVVRLFEITRILDRDYKGEYPPASIAYLSHMMTCYDQALFIDTQTLLVPRGLKNKATRKFNKEKALRARFTYESILPKSLFPKLIVNLYRYAFNFGTNAIFLKQTNTHARGENQENSALILKHESKNDIDIYVNGAIPRGDLMQVISNAFARIHKFFKGLNSSEQVFHPQKDPKGKYPKSKENILKKFYDGNKKNDDFDLGRCRPSDFLEISTYDPSGAKPLKERNDGKNINVKIGGDVHLGPVFKHSNTIYLSRQNLDLAENLANALNQAVALLKKKNEVTKETEIFNRLQDKLGQIMRNKGINPQDKNTFKNALHKAKDASQKISSIVEYGAKTANIFASIPESMDRIKGFIINILGHFPF